ncbi:uncharacterized protein LOC141609146 [Silene latifolia]|uniref:uncharacterized protein LOC141609146 n=1 Tax=Silene latifolia TaxID=37657 RepID=UPI003D784269
MGKMKLSLAHGFRGTYPVSPNTVYWNEAKLMAKQILKSHQDKMDSPPRTVRLLKADYYSVKGLMFNITFRVKGVDGVSVAYTAEVWFNICDEGIKVLAFGKVHGSERKPKNLEVDGSNNSDKKVSTKKMGKEGLDVFKGLSSPVPMTTNSELDSRLVTCLSIL